MTTEQTRNVWTKTSVRQILKNEAYKGTYLFNTRTYINGKHYKRPESEWERIENNHEAIISIEMFEQAQQALKSRITGKVKKKPNHESVQRLLRGLVFCEHCEHRLLFQGNRNQRHYFYCLHCKNQGDEMKYYRSDKIEQEIMKSLAPRLETIRPKQSKVNVLREIECLKAQKLSCFQDYKENNLSRDAYISKKQVIDKEIVELEESLQAGESLQLPIDNSLTQELIERYVEKIVVDCLGFFKVIYK